jgi:hypothetical protein
MATASHVRATSQMHKQQKHLISYHFRSKTGNAQVCQQATANPDGEKSAPLGKHPM